MAQRARPRHTERDGHGIGRVPGDKRVVPALIRLRKARKPAELAQRLEERLPPGEGLMYIALVAHVEDQPIPRRVKHAVDGHGQLHHAQIGSQMPARL